MTLRFEEEGGKDDASFGGGGRRKMTTSRSGTEKKDDDKQKRDRDTETRWKVANSDPCALRLSFRFLAPSKSTLMREGGREGGREGSVEVPVGAKEGGVLKCSGGWHENNFGLVAPHWTE